MFRIRELLHYSQFMLDAKLEVFFSFILTDISFKVTSIIMSQLREKKSNIIITTRKKVDVTFLWMLHFITKTRNCALFLRGEHDVDDDGVVDRHLQVCRLSAVCLQFCAWMKIPHQCFIAFVQLSTTKKTFNVLIWIVFEHVRTRDKIKICGCRRQFPIHAKRRFVRIYEWKSRVVFQFCLKTIASRSRATHHQKYSRVIEYCKFKIAQHACGRRAEKFPPNLSVQ